MLPLGVGGTAGDCPAAVITAVVGVVVVVAGVAVAVVVVVAVVGPAASPSESGSGFTMVKMGGRVSTQQEGREKNEKKG